ncbi:MAG: hypothetical protein M3Y87_00730, partial [Myxococcota bacterium]|nr:hypothetical protein [Myxococcota bacterium]
MRSSRTSALHVGVRLALVLAIVAPSLSCADEAEPGVLLVVTADPEVRGRADAVRLHVEGGRASDATELRETRGVADVDWPLRVVILPRDGDTTRALHIELDALDAQQRSIAQLRAAPHFEAGRMRIVALHFEAQCLDVSCPDGQTCNGGRCAPIPMPPDAGVADPGDAGTRAIARDAAIPATNDDACAPRVVYV